MCWPEPEEALRGPTQTVPAPPATMQAVMRSMRCFFRCQLVRFLGPFCSLASRRVLMAGLPQTPTLYSSHASRTVLSLLENQGSLLAATCKGSRPQSNELTGLPLLPQLPLPSQPRATRFILYAPTCRSTATIVACSSEGQAAGPALGSEREAAAGGAAQVGGTAAGAAAAQAAGGPG